MNVLQLTRMAKIDCRLLSALDTCPTLLVVELVIAGDYIMMKNDHEIDRGKTKQLQNARIKDRVVRSS